jgi:hypothetical protein
MEMAKFPGLYQRGDVWWFRRVVPGKYRAVIGKREIIESLDTKDRAEATQRYFSVAKRANDLIEQAKSGKLPVRQDWEIRTLAKDFIEWEFPRDKREFTRQEDFALHQLAKGGAPDPHMTNLVSDIERIRALYQLCWKLFNHGIEDIHGTRWNGDEAYTPDSINPMIDGSNDATKRLYNIVIAYIDAQMPSEKELQAKFQHRVADEANRKFPTKKQ